MLKHMHSSASIFLLKIFNQIWLQNVYPDTWRNAIVLSFVKPYKPPTLVTSYRPISLTSCVGKLQGKIVNIRLMNYLEANNTLPLEQFGFRRMRSTTDSSIKITTDIYKAFADGQDLVGLFADMTKADMEARYIDDDPCSRNTWPNGILHCKLFERS